MNSPLEDISLNTYFKELAQSSPLSREREAELANKIKAGDLQARDQLVQANLPFVVNVARNYQRRGLSFGEIISAGNMGLITAAERFDADRGCKFITYAVWWIKQSILLALTEQSRTVRLPSNKMSLLYDITRTSEQLSQGRAEPPNAKAIALELDLPIDQVEDTLLSGQAICSLDDELKDGQHLLDTLSDATQEAPDDAALRNSAKEQVHSILSNLEEKERQIIIRYYGMDGNEPLTLEEIGSQLGLTRERIRQIKERALNKLRHPSKQKMLDCELEYS
jgi:RNA polymerase primary sigma factor